MKSFAQICSSNSKRENFFPDVADSRHKTKIRHLQNASVPIVQASHGSRPSRVRSHYNSMELFSVGDDLKDQWTR